MRRARVEQHDALQLSSKLARFALVESGLVEMFMCCHWLVQEFSKCGFLEIGPLSNATSSTFRQAMPVSRQFAVSHPVATL